MGKSILTVASGNTTAVKDATTAYFNLIGLPHPATTEPNTEVPIRSAGTLSDLAVYISANDVNAATTATIRKSRANTSVVATITANSTGWFYDNTNTASFANTDELSLSLAPGSVGGNHYVTLLVATVVFDATSDTVCLVGFGYGDVVNGYNVADATYYGPLSGGTAPSYASEAATKVRLRQAFTASNLYIYVTVNARTSSTVFYSRKNGADGSLVVTVEASGTGVFEDTTHTDSLASGDDYNVRVTLGTGGNTIAVSIFSIWLTNSSGYWLSVMSNGSTDINIGAAQTYYYEIAGYNSTDIAETWIALLAQFDYTLKNLSCYATNTNGNTHNIYSRDNLADGTQVLSFNTAGLKEDTTHTDTITGGTDEVDTKIVTSASAGLSLSWVSYLGYSGTGTQTPVTLTAATATHSGSVDKLPNKSLSAAVDTLDATISNLIGKSLDASMTTVDASLLKLLSRALDATASTLAGALSVSKTVLQVLTATTATLAGGISRYIGKVLRSPNLNVLQSSISLLTGQNYPRELLYISSKGKLYTSLSFGPIIRFNNPTTDLTDHTDTVGTIAGNHLIYIPAKDKLYSCGYVNQNHIEVWEIDPTAWTFTRVIDYNPVTEDYSIALTFDDTYLYVIATPNAVYRFLLSDFSYSNKITITGMSSILAIENDGSHIFVTSTDSPGIISRIDPTTFTVEDTYTLPSGKNVITDDFCFAGNYVFVALESSGSQNVVRIQKDSLSTIDVIDTGISASCWGTFYDGTYVWAVYSNGTIVVIDPSTLAFRPYVLPSANTNEIVIVPSGDIFVTHYGAPGSVSQIDYPLDPLHDSALILSNASVVKLLSRALSAAYSSWVGELVRQCNKILLATIEVLSGVLVKSAQKILSATNSLFDVVFSAIKQAGQYYEEFTAAMQTAAGDLIKSTTKTLDTAWTGFAGSTIRSLSRALDSAWTGFVGTLNRLLSRSLDATWTGFAGVLDLVRAFLRSLDATMQILSGTITKQINKMLPSSIQALSADIGRLTNKISSATISLFNGTIDKLVSKLLTATNALFSVVFEAIKLAGVHYEAFTAAMQTMAGSIVKQINKTLPATIELLVGTVAKFTSKFNSATNALISGSLVKQINKIFEATLQIFAGALSATKIAILSFSASAQTFAGELIKSTNKVFAAATATHLGTITKAISKFFAAIKSLWAAILTAIKNALAPQTCTKYLNSPINATITLDSSITNEAFLSSNITKEIKLDGNLCW